MTTESLVVRIALSLLIAGGAAFIWRNVYEERKPTVATSLSWLAGCALVGAGCSGYLLYAAPKTGPVDIAPFCFAVILEIGMAYLVGPSLLRLFRAGRENAGSRLAALMCLGLILAAASFSPLALFYHFFLAQDR